METLITFFQENIDYHLFFAIILGGIFITKYTKEITQINNTYKVFIASVFFSIVVYFVNECTRDCLSKYLITYLLATSFYELFVRTLTDFVKKTVDNKKNNYKKNE